MCSKLPLQAAVRLGLGLARMRSTAASVPVLTSHLCTHNWSGARSFSARPGNRKSSADKDFVLAQAESTDDEAVSGGRRGARRGVGGRSGAAKSGASAVAAAPKPAPPAASDSDSPSDGCASEESVTQFVDPVFGIVRPVGAAEYSGYPSTEEDEAAGQRAGGRPSTAAAGGGVSSDDGEESEVDVEELRERMARDPALRRRAYKQAMYQRRNTRTMLGNDSEEAETYAAAFAREFSHDIELTDVEDITRPDDYKKGTGDDPLERMGLPFSVHALTFKSHMDLTSVAKSQSNERRVRVTAVVSQMGLDKPTAQYVRAIAGTHYQRVHDRLIISSDKHEESALNRREVLEQLVSLVIEAQRLRGQFGEMPRIKHMTRYSH